MKNIHVRRFSTPNVSVQGLVEPEDKSWLVVIDAHGEATFWRQCPDPSPFEPKVDDGAQHELYLDAELPGGSRLVSAEGTPVVEVPPAPAELNPLDFTVIPSDEAGRQNSDPETPGFWARLNARHVMCFGETEHEAVRALLNYVAQLCTAGCLDHTGQPMPGHSKRRYDAVFGPRVTTD